MVMGFCIVGPFICEPDQARARSRRRRRAGAAERFRQKPGLSMATT